MRIITLPSWAITKFGSHGVGMDFLPRAIGGARTSTNVARIAAGGRLGEHPATLLQVFALLAGEAVVTSRGEATGPTSDSASEAGERFEIAAGQAAIWEAGEVHETVATTDMLAVILETDGVLDLDHHFRQVWPA